MGLYPVKCKRCEKTFAWFFGLPTCDYCTVCVNELHVEETIHRHIDCPCDLCKNHIEAMEKAAIASAENMGSPGPDKIFIEGYTLTEIIEQGLKALKTRDGNEQ